MTQRANKALQATAKSRPRLIAALSTDRSRFNSSLELQCYSGIAPVVKASGKQRWVHSRWACPKFVRQTFHEWALHSIGQCDWARDYYQAQRPAASPTTPPFAL